MSGIFNWGDDFLLDQLHHIATICTCGVKGSKDSGLFHIRLKAHAEEEDLSEDEWRESKLLGYTVEDDIVLGRPKS